MQSAVSVSRAPIIIIIPSTSSIFQPQRPHFGLEASSRKNWGKNRRNLCFHHRVGSFVRRRRGKEGRKVREGVADYGIPTTGKQTDRQTERPTSNRCVIQCRSKASYFFFWLFCLSCCSLLVCVKASLVACRFESLFFLAFSTS